MMNHFTTTAFTRHHSTDLPLHYSSQTEMILSKRKYNLKGHGLKIVNDFSHKMPKLQVKEQNRAKETVFHA